MMRGEFTTNGTTCRCRRRAFRDPVTACFQQIAIAGTAFQSFNEVLDDEVTFHSGSGITCVNEWRAGKAFHPYGVGELVLHLSGKAKTRTCPSAGQYTPLLPCCRDRFGEQSCQALRRTQPAQFEKRCLSDHDFNTISCCAECRKYIKFHNIHPENSKSLLRAPVVCHDKHSLSFCRRFKASGMGKFSCGDAEFAVRVCRHTCGYCNDALYDGKNVAPLCAANVASSLGPNYSFLRTRLY